ncbi:hypothetical protein [Nocardiopsis eucommiae]
MTLTAAKALTPATGAGSASTPIHPAKTTHPGPQPTLAAAVRWKA